MKKRLTREEFESVIMHFASQLGARTSQLEENQLDTFNKFLQDCYIRPGTFFRAPVIESLNDVFRKDPFIYQVVEDVMFTLVCTIGNQDGDYERLCWNLSEALDVTGPQPHLSYLPVEERLWSAANTLEDTEELEQQKMNWLARLIARANRPIPITQTLLDLLLNNRHLVFLCLCTYMNIVRKVTKTNE